jgi:hypothetical protein
MALATGVQGARRPAQLITWARDDGAPEDLTGATLTGKLHNRGTGETRAIAGPLTVTDAAGGVFRWDYAAEDVAEAGRFDVQFDAAFAAGQTPARTFVTRWEVQSSLA